MYAIPDDKLANAQQVSKSLVQARLNWTGLPEFPGDLPTSLHEAYGIQALSIKAWPTPVVGWKIGGVTKDHQYLGAKSQVGPVFKDNLVYHKGKPLRMRAVKDGFVAVEGEIVIKTKIDLKPGDYESIALQDMIASVHMGVEIASSPIALVNQIGPMCIITDFGNNAGQIVGREIKDWRDRDFNDLFVTVTIDGKRVGRKPVGPFIDGPMKAFAFLVKSCSDRGFDIPAGSYITTGAISGVHDTHIGTKSIVDFEGVGRIDIELISGAG